MKPKCLTCNGCCDIIWVMPRRFYHCWFCNIYYDIIDKKLTLVDMQQLTSVPKDELDAIYYPKPESRFK